jgi:hypothetical protein
LVGSIFLISISLWISTLDLIAILFDLASFTRWDDFTIGLS